MGTHEVVSCGIAMPRVWNRETGQVSGCIHRADGSRVRLSERVGGHQGDLIVSANPERIEMPQKLEHLPGRGLYLGDYMRHYGHFITETLSTCWILDEIPASRFDYFLFHPFIFGSKLSSYAQFCFSKLGIPEDRIVIVDDQPLRFDTLVVPERMLQPNLSVDHQVHGVYRRIAADYSRPDDPGGRIYLSKRRFCARSRRRTTVNENEIEEQFCSRGFQVVYPEELPLPRQLDLYANAEIVAGLSGSALMNSLFMRRGARLIELGDPRFEGARSPTQALCDSISGVDPIFVPFEGRRIGPKCTMIFDIAYLDDTLTRIGLGERQVSRWEARLARLRAAPEIASRALRPLASHVAQTVGAALRRPDVRPARMRRAE